LLGLAGAVDVGGVDEVDAGVEGRVDDPDRLVVVRVAPGAKHHRAEAKLADRDAGASQGPVLHTCSLRCLERPARGRDALLLCQTSALCTWRVPSTPSLSRKRGTADGPSHPHDHLRVDKRPIATSGSACGTEWTRASSAGRPA